MYFKRYFVCSLFGIPLYVDLSFALVSVLMLSGGVMLAVVGSVVLAVSIIAHELGHSLTAHRYGFATRDITLSVSGGCAALEGIPKDPLREFMVALNGPLVSFAFAAAGFLGSCVFHDVPVLGYAFWYMTAINLMLGMFNLLPGFPMDGGRILRAFLMKYRRQTRLDATYRAMIVGRHFAVVLASLGMISMIAGSLGGMSSLLVAYFIWKAGEAEYRMPYMRP